MVMRKLVHAALFLVISLAGVAVLFLILDAPFAAFAQLLVYVGAVAILILFAILLTRNAGEVTEDKSGIISGLAVTLLAGGTIAACIVGSGLLQRSPIAMSGPSAREIGEHLLSRNIIPVEIIAILLTAALLGAIILALEEMPPREEQK